VYIFAGCLFYLLFDSNDAGNTFIRNVGELLPDYTAVTSQKMVVLVATAVRLSNPDYVKLFLYETANKSFRERQEYNKLKKQFFLTRDIFVVHLE
jgi:hypothetical protein